MNKNLKKWFSGVTAVVVIALAVMAFTPSQTVSAASDTVTGGPGGGRGGRGNGTGSGTQPARIPLSETEITALTEAIYEEYGALNLYKAVIAQFGEITPFVEIAASEQRHLDALIKQAVKYGVVVPANPGLTTAANFATIEDACAAGVAAEIADADLYDQLTSSVTHTDILRVFEKLQAASLENHLPEFELCQ